MCRPTCRFKRPEAPPSGGTIFAVAEQAMEPVVANRLIAALTERDAEGASALGRVCVSVFSNAFWVDVLRWANGNAECGRCPTYHGRHRTLSALSQGVRDANVALPVPLLPERPVPFRHGSPFSLLWR